MATISVTNVTNTGFTWQIQGLGFVWDTTQYKSCYVSVSGYGSSSSQFPPPPTGSSTNAPSIPVAFSGTLTQNTGYTVTGYIITAANVTVATTNSIPITTAGIPTGIPSVSASPQTGHQTYVSWSSVARATTYNYYANNVYKGNTPNLYAYIPTDYEYTMYNFDVYGVNSYGAAVNPNFGRATARSLDETFPTYGSINSNSVAATSSTITIQVLGVVDVTPSGGSSSGIASVDWYRNDGYITTSNYAGSSTFSYQHTGLTPNTTYTFFVRIKDNAGKTIDTSPKISQATPYALPSGTPTVSLTAKTGHLMDVSWTTVTGATKYEVWKTTAGAADYYQGETTNLFWNNVTVDAEYRDYTFLIKPWNPAGYGTTGSKTTKSLDETYPSYGAFTSPSQTSTTINVYVTNANDPIPSTTPTSFASGIASVDWYRNGGYIATTNYAGSADFSYQHTGLIQDTSYDFFARIKDNAAHTFDTVTIPKKTLLPLPSGTPTITATPVAGHQTNLSWTAVTDAAKYEVWKTAASLPDYYQGETTGLSFVVPTDAEYVDYTFKIKPWNATGYGTTGSKTAKSLDEKDPAYNTFYATDNQPTQITVVITNVYDPPPNTTPVSSSSGIKTIEFYKNDVLDYSTPSSGNDVYRTYLGLTTNIQYKLYAKIYDNVGRMTKTVEINPTTVPSGTPIITATPVAGHQTNLSWTGVTGATAYEVWKTAAGVPDYYVNDTSGTTYNVSTDAEFIDYTFKIIPKNAGGKGTTGTKTIKSLDETYPAYNSIYTTEVKGDEITVIVKNVYDPIPQNTTPVSAASGIKQVDFYKDGVFNYSFVTVGNDVYRTYDKLQPNVTYELYAIIYDNNQLLSTQTISIYPKTIPTGIPVITATPQIGHQTYLSWTASTGATAYEVWKNAGGTDYYVNDTTGLNYTVPTDAEYINYTFKIIPKNSGGSGTAGTIVSRTLDETLPAFHDFYTIDILGSQISVKVIAAYDPIPDTVPSSAASGIVNVEFYQDGSLVGSVPTIGNDVNFVYQNLLPNHTYALYAIIYDKGTNKLPTNTINPKTQISATRPPNFSWKTPKVSGGIFLITASEWNDLTTKINQFRTYQAIRLNPINFPNMLQTDLFTAIIYNQVIDAIQEMNPPIALPPKKNLGDLIKASELNQLVDSLNSIP